MLHVPSLQGHVGAYFLCIDNKLHYILQNFPVHNAKKRLPEEDPRWFETCWARNKCNISSCNLLYELYVTYYNGMHLKVKVQWSNSR
jgi:hypothetical protein